MAKDEKKVPPLASQVPPELAAKVPPELASKTPAELAAMAQQVSEALERASGDLERLASLKRFILSLSPYGYIGMNEPVYAAWQQLNPEAKPAVQFVHRKKETLLVPADALADNAVLLEVGKSGLTAGCRGRKGFYKNDVPEALVGTVHLKIEIRDETKEPQWKNCFAVPFKPATPARKTNSGKGKKDGQEGEQTTANKKTQVQKKTEQQQNTNTQQTTVHSQQNTDQNKAAAGQEGQG